MTTQGLPAHGEHERRSDVTHMCPECGITPRIFCEFCCGTGQLTDLQLMIWQRKTDERAQASQR